MAFCDFCECENCRTGVGPKGLKFQHAPTADGRWICSTCFTYDVCTSGPKRAAEPCEKLDCEHRPRLAGEFQPAKTAVES